MKINFFALAIILLFSLSAQALENDKRLVVRLLGLSSSKKTILINRGREEGIKIGDHAKFSNPVNGYFARGTVSRVSPTRSVWSLYRIIKPEALVENTVVTLKAASPVKLTRDESKALGILARSFEKIDDPTAEDKGEENQLKDHLIQAVVRDSSAFKGVDYTELFENSAPEQKDANVDWRGVDGELDEIKSYEGIEFNSLNERFRDL
jgi:hypothetical protein